MAGNPTDNIESADASGDNKKIILDQMIEVIPCELRTMGFYKDEKLDGYIGKIPMFYRSILDSLLPYEGWFIPKLDRVGGLVMPNPNLIKEIIQECRDKERVILRESYNDIATIQSDVEGIVLSVIIREKKRLKGNVLDQELKIYQCIDSLEDYANSHLTDEKKKAALHCVRQFRKVTLEHYMPSNESLSKNTECAQSNGLSGVSEAKRSDELSSQSSKKSLKEELSGVIKSKEKDLNKNSNLCGQLLLCFAIACTGLGIFYLAYQSYQARQDNKSGTVPNIFDTRSHRLASQVVQSSQPSLSNHQ